MARARDHPKVPKTPKIDFSAPFLAHFLNFAHLGAGFSEYKLIVDYNMAPFDFPKWPPLVGFPPGGTQNHTFGRLWRAPCTPDGHVPYSRYCSSMPKVWRKIVFGRGKIPRRAPETVLLLVPMRLKRLSPRISLLCVQRVPLNSSPFRRYRRSKLYQLNFPH